MKKYFWFKIVCVVYITIAWTVCAQATVLKPVASFDTTWGNSFEGGGPGGIGTAGTKITFNVQGYDGGESLAKLSKTGTEGVIGLMANLRVDKIAGYSRIGIQESVGQVGGSKIQGMICLEQYQNHNSIRYSITAIDLLNTDSRVTLTQGSIGDWDYTWLPGESITVAVARVGAEVWFYVVGYPQLLKLQLLNEVTAYNGSLEAFAWTDIGTQNSISGSVSAVYLIYP